MDKKYGFLKMSVQEFEAWLPAQSISRTVRTVQQHHTWRPGYAEFNGNNHFTVQKGMKNYHVGTNGWSDIGQHISIFPDGAVVTGRPFNRTPACILGANSGCFCIESVGNFDNGKDSMTSAQKDSIIRVTAAFLKKIGQSAPNQSNIVYHHWYDAGGNKLYGKSAVKSCPGSAFFGGNKLSDFEREFLPLVKKAMNGGIMAPALLLRWVSVTAGSLNIRTGPSSTKPIASGVTSLRYGSILRVYKERNDWLKISSTKDHWVFGRYTHTVSPATVNTDGSNGRTGPGMQNGIAATYDQGHQLFVYETNGSWARVDEFQWIHNSLIDPA